METERRNDFTKGPIGRVILRMAVPMMVAQLVNVMYSIVDRMYIGHIPDTGSLALTGIGLTMPMISIITAFANLCGMGGAPLCSIARGRGDNEYAEKVMANAYTMLLILGVVITVGLSFFLRPVLYLFGASDVTYPYAAAYARVYVLGTVFVMMSLGMNSFINSQGFARTGMLTVMFGAAVNIVLDPVFIFVFDMGAAGAAVATVISQLCSAVWALAFLSGRKAILRFRVSRLVLIPRIVGRIASLGITGFVMGATTGFTQIICNKQLLLYGGDLYVGVMTVVNSVREVVFMTINGLTSGAQPVLGYNYGARAYDRVRGGIRFVTAAGLVYSVAAWAVVMLFPRALIMIFNSEEHLVAAGVPALRMYLGAFVVMSLQIAGQSIYVGLGKSKHAICFSLLRKVVIAIPLTLLLPGLWGLGVNGVFLAEPISDVIGGTACYLTMYLTVYRRLKTDSGAQV